jgi:REP element-mobilizing transposase RayT
MARKPRIHYPGALYHVMLWGNAGEKIFFEDGDRRQLLKLVEQGVRRFGHRIHAFCLMPNHVHFAIQVGEVPLSKIMQNLSFRYTAWFNNRRGRRGHLFHGRYKAILVDRDAYLLELTRYIHLNPVRAGMVQDPMAYPWSGHRTYLGKRSLPWLTTDWVLGQLGKQMNVAQTRYAHFVGEGVGGGRREEFHRGTGEGRMLGDDDFVSRALARAGARLGRPAPLRAIVAAVCREVGLREFHLRAPGRGSQGARARWLVSLLATDLNSATLTEVARDLGRDVATLSNGVRYLRERAVADRQFRQRITRLMRALGKNKTSKA